jgi:hypothetical protein
VEAAGQFFVLRPKHTVGTGLHDQHGAGTIARQELSRFEAGPRDRAKLILARVYQLAVSSVDVPDLDGWSEAG